MQQERETGVGHGVEGGGVGGTCCLNSRDAREEEGDFT